METTLVRQAQASECGLACLAMLAGFHGLHLDMGELRRRFAVSIKGANLQQLISHASSLGFACRPLRLELHELSQLALPCVLHWDLNHFVVLTRVSRRGVVILDPAAGERRLRMHEVSRHFTGVALEASPTADFRAADVRPRIRLSQLTGRVSGLARSVLQIAAVALVLELFALVAPLFNQLVVDEALSSQDRELLTVLALGFGLLLVAQTLIGLARSWMVMVLGQTLSLQWLGNVFAHLIHLPVDWFERRYMGDVVSRFSSVSAIQKTLTTNVIEAVLDGVMALAALVMMLLYAPALAAVTVSAVLLYGVLRGLAYRPLREASADRLVLAARENSHFLETLRAITPLKLFGREDERRARWQNLIVDVHNRDLRTSRLQIGFSAANAFIFGVENLVVFWLGARLVMKGQADQAMGFTLGMLFAYVSYKTQFTGRVSALIHHAIELKMLGLHTERLADIALTEPEHHGTPSLETLNLEPSLELRNVSFRYGEGEPWLLRHVNFKVAAGDCVAVVGPSGCGKTTLLKILLGLLAPTEGEVRYGGVPVRQLGLRNLRRRIGTVMQDDVMLTGSLADNISFFDVHPNLPRIEACARWANVHEDILRMPMGYQTLAGDLGSGLSGGQKQRILLARALYKDPQVLALDEATSHLDVGSERAVTQELGRLNITRLVIAHRPDTIAGARRVVRLRDGVVEDVPNLSIDTSVQQVREALRDVTNPGRQTARPG
jgi:ATP-binding cassette, subfamily B, bacterial CvaB/MchF/RaxB